MTKLVPAAKVADKRLERFLNEVRNICQSPGQFKRKIDVNVSHIAFRASQTGADIRNAMGNEEIASVLLHGTVNERHSRPAGRVELAIEGKFSELSYVKYGEKIEEVKCRDAAMRVVIREGDHKHIVVTLYPLKENDADLNSLPEVPRNVW